ncbi:uncharacterized protein STAUR_4935 [Stigmatella aurantiaca DW4/3-1]|uniref:TubF protein n=1 Tax=Stigmatella aurantiaca (strain DW4/3-1) TaxID=378806 RepID=Q093L4_STIAD|nr:uncharacterized protein STAUR_4935 [Stigmatella aurantiaca DW4/3-1]EAU66933.1 TubF protein [Stigmatella aurantiaca DW4/3-1]
MGLTLAEHLARRVSARLVLTGRSPTPPREHWDAWFGPPTQLRLAEERSGLREAAGLPGAVLLVELAPGSPGPGGLRRRECLPGRVCRVEAGPARPPHGVHRLGSLAGGRRGHAPGPRTHPWTTGGHGSAAHGAGRVHGTLAGRERVVVGRAPLGRRGHVARRRLPGAGPRRAGTRTWARAAGIPWPTVPGTFPPTLNALPTVPTARWEAS